MAFSFNLNPQGSNRTLLLKSDLTIWSKLLMSKESCVQCYITQHCACQTLSLSLSHTHTYKPSLFLSLSHTHTHTLTHTHTQNQYTHTHTQNQYLFAFDSYLCTCNQIHIQMASKGGHGSHSSIITTPIFHCAESHSPSLPM